MKRCSKCRQDKPLSAFNKCKAKKDGLHSYCRDCNKATCQEWVSRNYDKNLERARQWAIDNPERNRARASAWSKANPEMKQAQSRKWKHANPGKVRANTQARRARIANNGVYSIPAKFLKRLYASPCFYCGSTDNIQADHVIPIARGGVHSMGNLVPACRSCNSAKCDKTISEWRLTLPSSGEPQQ